MYLKRRRVNPVTLMIWRGQPKTKTSDITPLKGKVGRRESGLLETQKLLLLETERMRYWLSAGKSVTVDPLSGKFQPKCRMIALAQTCREAPQADRGLDISSAATVHPPSIEHLGGGDHQISRPLER